MVGRMTGSIHIEEKDYGPVETAATIRRALRREEAGGRWFSEPDLVMLTGLPEREVRAGILYLAGALDGDLREHDGELEIKLEDLDKSTLELRLPGFLQPAFSKLKGLVPLLRNAVSTVAVLGVTSLWLFAYAGVLMNLIPDSLPTLKTAGALFAVVCLMVVFVLSIPLFPAVLIAAAYVKAFSATFVDVEPVLAVSFWGLALGGTAGFVAVLAKFKQYYSRFFGWAGKKLSWLTNFGKPRRDALYDERNFLALVREHDGRLTIGDLMALYGWTHARAFEELTRLMLDYGGDVEVDEEGRITFDFSDLAERSSEAAGDVDARPVWEAEKRPAEAFDEKARRADKWLLGGWALSTAPFLATIAARAPQLWEAFQQATLAQQVMQAAGFGLLAIVPVFVALRRMVVWWRDRKYDQRAQYIDVLQKARANGGEVVLDADQLADLDERVVLDLDAELEVDDDEARLVVSEFEAPDGSRR